MSNSCYGCPWLETWINCNVGKCYGAACYDDDFDQWLCLGCAYDSGIKQSNSMRPTKFVVECPIVPDEDEDEEDNLTQEQINQRYDDYLDSLVKSTSRPSWCKLHNK